MWIRCLLGLLILNSVGKVQGQVPAAGTPAGTSQLTGIPNIINQQLVSPYRCPEGWLKRNKRCYFFSETKASWYGAEAQCRIMGGYLSIPDTEEENNFLKERSLSERTRIQGGLQHISDFSRWIGLRSLDGATVTKIITNDTPTFTNFRPTEPNNLVNNMCIKLDDDFNFTWAAQQCFRTLFYICERQLAVYSSVIRRQNPETLDNVLHATFSEQQV
ncbi:perlucin-like protein [Ylistrum balloti]|uniref:perlucin-like protein n=1 Tax=Ylistrum balloti TaxID=509963 RepID=UPI002905E44F|nr:perlucin-like protein [Ylistrum balloti]